MKLLVLGAESPVGAALVRLLQEQNVEHAVLATDELDLLKQNELLKKITRCNPTQIINATSSITLIEAENDPDAASRLDITNTWGVSTLAEVCKHLELPLLHHSSSYVFDGQKVHPYSETDESNPVCRYGQSKWYGERAIRDALPSHVILRTDWIFSRQTTDYFREHIGACKRGHGQIAIMGNRLSPTPASDVARVMLAIARQVDCAAEVWGTYHYCALQPMSQDHFVENFLQEAGRYDDELATALTSLQITKLPVTLPFIANSALNCQRLFETFGIKQRSRAAEMNLLLQDIYGIKPAAPAATPVSEPPSPDKRKAGEGRNSKTASASNNAKKNKGQPQASALAKSALRKTTDSSPPSRTDAAQKGSQQP